MLSILSIILERNKSENDGKMLFHLDFYRVNLSFAASEGVRCGILRAHLRHLTVLEAISNGVKSRFLQPMNNVLKVRKMQEKRKVLIISQLQKCPKFDDFRTKVYFLSNNARFLVQKFRIILTYI